MVYTYHKIFVVNCVSFLYKEKLTIHCTHTCNIAVAMDVHFAFEFLCHLATIY